MLNEKFIHFYHWFTSQLINLNIGANTANIISVLLFISVLILALWGITKIILMVVNKFIHKFYRSNRPSFLNYLLKSRFINILVLFIPWTFFERIFFVILEGDTLYGVIDGLVASIKTILMVLLIREFLKSSVAYLKTRPSFQDKPLDSYSQIIFIITLFCAIASVYINITDQSLSRFFTAIGAISAVLMLIFKDTILGVVSSIQLSANNMLKINDWITFSKYGADGSVIEINLTTVKVQNFDKTITTVPTYALIADSFQNWRGMQESGARRIKRNIRIRFSSVKLITHSDLERYKKIDLLKGFIEQRQKEIDNYNQAHRVNQEILINGRNLTNIGLFREYINLYLRQRTDIRQDLTLMVRQLQSNEYGIPIEVYCFTADNRWVVYEGVQSDIFDHLYSVAPFFELVIYEY